MDLDKIKSIEQIYTALIFVAPGLIIVYIRALFIAGRRPRVAEYAVEYVVVSTIYLAAAVPLLEWIISLQGPNWFRVLAWLGLLAAVPAAIGLALGAASQNGWWRSALGWLRLSVVSPYPTGWDWVFARLKSPAYLLITLRDDSTVAGYFGLGSLASSDPSERDLYLEEIYDVGDDGTWTSLAERHGILIAAKEIKYIEIWRTSGSEEPNG